MASVIGIEWGVKPHLPLRTSPQHVLFVSHADARTCKGF